MDIELHGHNEGLDLVLSQKKALSGKRLKDMRHILDWRILVLALGFSECLSDLGKNHGHI